MSLWRKCIVIAPVSFSISVLITSCNDTKVAQCQRLIETVNEGTSLLEQNKGTQVTLSLRLVKDLEAVKNKMDRQNFRDPQLQGYKDQFVKHFDTFGQNISTAAKALGSAKTADSSLKGREQVRKAEKDIQTALKTALVAAKQSDDLAVEVNKYCDQLE